MFLSFSIIVQLSVRHILITVQSIRINYINRLENSLVSFQVRHTTYGVWELFSTSWYVVQCPSMIRTSNGWSRTKWISGSASRKGKNSPYSLKISFWLFSNHRQRGGEYMRRERGNHRRWHMLEIGVCSVTPHLRLERYCMSKLLE